MNSGNPESKSKQNRSDRRPLKIFLAGDVMSGRGIDQVLPKPSDPVLYEDYMKDARRYVELTRERSGMIPEEVSYEYIWGEGLVALEQIRPHHRVINLETAVTSSNTPWPGKGIHYRMHPANVQVLTAAGIDTCTIGNNHILDWGYEGLRETLSVLDASGINVCGAGMNLESAARPVLTGYNSGRLLIISCAGPDAGIPEEWGAGEDKAGVFLLENYRDKGFESIRRITDGYRGENDRVLLSIHWGGNWGYDIAVSHRKFAHKLIKENLVDVVFGHSSHHPKAIEVYNGKLILYGCGDLVNDYEGITGYEEYRGNLSCMYFPVIDSDGLLSNLQIVPFKIHRFRLTRPGKEDVRWLAGRMDRECHKYGSSIILKEDNHLELHI